MLKPLPTYKLGFIKLNYKLTSQENCAPVEKLGIQTFWKIGKTDGKVVN